MAKIDLLILTFLLSQLVKTIPSCSQYKNNCEICHPINNLCIKCLSDNYFPDENGGCEPKCTLGKNFCNECDEDSKLCNKCENGYFPDKIGGCSYMPNCKSSYKGKCLECEEDYILIGDNSNFQICQNINSEDLKNCKNINLTNGHCIECEEGYYQNKGDLKCSQIENCYESIYSICTSCINGYFLNKKQNKCQKIEENDNFSFCKETIDGVNCDSCIFGYYLAENGQCSNALMCSETKNGKCLKCSENFFLTEDNFCTSEEKCQFGDGRMAVCDYCYSGYYLDKKDKKCKIQDGEEFNHCDVYENGCLECELGYYKGGDLKCIKTKNCHESENGICIICKDEYYLGLDNKCSPVEHCIFSGEGLFECDECDEGYYFSVFNKTCLKSRDNFQNCKVAIYDGSKCGKCKNNYYLNYSNYLCYDNTDTSDHFYKCDYTDYNGEKCEKCIDGYYLTSGDEKCTKINYCKYSINENECDYCEEGYCLDVKKQKCFDNDFLENENQKIYIACNKTNEEGNKCEICLDGYEINENGFCVDIERCEEKENNVCIKCKDDNTTINGYYCTNEIYGCLKTYMYGCKKCNNLNDLYSCTECYDGYFLNEEKRCITETNEENEEEEVN